jgi:hypothetical protein
MPNEKFDIQGAEISMDQGQPQKRGRRMETADSMSKTVSAVTQKKMLS